MNPLTAPITGFRTTALCYVCSRPDLDGDGSNDLVRERANIEALCQQQGWRPEWYQDIWGAQKRSYPAWQALKARLGDPDVAALVVHQVRQVSRGFQPFNELSTLLMQHDVAFAVAAPGSQAVYPASTARLVAQLNAAFEQWYAAGLSSRIKAARAYRQRRGKL